MIISWMLLKKLQFYPGALEYLSKIARELDYELVMVTNQDGLGTASFQKIPWASTPIDSRYF